MRCLDGILSSYGRPFLCCGDFNTSPAVVSAHVGGVRLANKDLHTYADVSIDNVLYTKGISVSDVLTVDATTVPVSDHNVLVCKVSVK